MVVITRTGKKKELNLRAIRDKIADAVFGIPGVSQEDIELDFSNENIFRDGMTTEEVNAEVIRVIVNKIDYDAPNYTFVAARIVLNGMYHSVGHVFDSEKGSPYAHSFASYLRRGYNEKKIVDMNRWYSDDEIHELGEYIKPENDTKIIVHENGRVEGTFTYLGIKTYLDKYATYTYDQKLMELPQHLFMALGMFLHAEEKKDRIEHVKEFYDAISNFELMMATPTLSNGRTPRHQLSSCFVGTHDDQLAPEEDDPEHTLYDGITGAFTEQAILSKFGGGIGWDWMNVRASDGEIDGFKGAAGGPIPFLHWNNGLPLAVDQLGCVARDSYVNVVGSVITNNFTHNFRQEYQTLEFSKKDLLQGVASFASSFAFEYGKFQKNFIASLLNDYILNMGGSKTLILSYGLTKDQYKRIIGRYKKISKGYPLGFESMIENNDYLISVNGVILHRDSLKMISQCIDRKGYTRAVLGKKSKTLHRLMAKQFISDFDESMTVDHDDGNKQNNTLLNFNVMSNENNISKGWALSKDKRTEMSRVRKHISNSISLNGNKRKTPFVEIDKIEIKTIHISQVRIGDLIESYNIESEKVEYKPVIATYGITVKQHDQIKLCYSDGNNIVTSVWHPFPVIRNKKTVYIRSDAVIMGDKTINNKGLTVNVISISSPNVNESFVDLTVRDNNNYFCSTDNENGPLHLVHNTRKGAIAVYLEPWHMDIYAFIDLKKTGGEERLRAHDLFPALWLNDEFMRRVENDEEWTLLDPYDVPELHGLYGEKFETAYRAYEKNPDVRKEVIKAKELWKRIITSYVETGMPFLCFKDTANEANMNKHVGVINSSNLCVVGDTKILTKMYGYTKIENVSGKTLECWDGTNWVDTPIFQTSENQAVVSVNLSNKASLECTPYHKWSVVVQDKFGGITGVIEKRTHELEVGDKLEKFKLSPIDHGSSVLPLAYENGFYTADGTKIKDNAVCGHKIYLYHEKKKLVDSFDGFKNKSETKERISLVYKHDDLFDKFFIPNNSYSLKSRLLWLAGYLDGDGTLTNNNGSESIQVASVNLQFLQDLMLLLQEIGIHSTVSNFKEAGYQKMPLNDKNNESGDFWCNRQDRLLIAGSELQKMLDLGYLANRVMPTRRDYNREARQYVSVVDVVDHGLVKPTFCGTSPINNKLIFDGVLTMNCTEIFQVTSPKRTAICNLGSVNWAKMKTKEQIIRTARILTRALDNVIDMNLYPIKKISETAKASRAIGVGVMGEAEMIAHAGIMYGSDEHLEFIDEKYAILREAVEDMSHELALEKGVYPEFEGSEWQRPMRNGYLMAIAPTSSISILVGTTQSTEPVYKKKWFEENLSGLIPVTAPGINPDNYQLYVNAFEVSQTRMIMAAAIRQKYVDQGMSLNIFIDPENTSGKEISDVLKLAWKLKVKSTYYLRSLSPDEEKGVSIPDRSMECSSCQ